jgi:threonylcarbamoyladenosine tRNA methylthiotransferase MtaB
VSAPVFSTFGCRLNAWETEAMKRLAARAGVQDAVVVNSCAVTAEAVRKARQDIRRLRRRHPGARIVVTGCAAQTDPDGFAAMAEVDHVLGNAEKLDPEAWARLAPDFTGTTERVRVGDIMSVRDVAPHLIDGFGSRARAFVQIQTGCDHRCTFCIIPYGRGNSRSVPAGVVSSRSPSGRGGPSRGRADRRRSDKLGRRPARRAAAWRSGPAMPPAGARPGPAAPVLDRLDRGRPGLMEAHGRSAPDAASAPVAAASGDDLILKRMKRRHGRDDAIRFCAEARRIRPDIVFGADIIAGFPTETEAAFENSQRLVAECGLTWLHVFPYSPRPGTPAARMPQLDGATIRDRAARLRAAGDAARRRFLAGEAGQTRPVLMETPRLGRTPHFAEVAFSSDRPEGATVAARILGVEGRRLRAA